MEDNWATISKATCSSSTHPSSFHLLESNNIRSSQSRIPLDLTHICLFCRSRCSFTQNWRATSEPYDMLDQQLKLSAGGQGFMWQSRVPMQKTWYIDFRTKISTKYCSTQLTHMQIEVWEWWHGRVMPRMASYYLYYFDSIGSWPWHYTNFLPLLLYIWHK